MQPDGTIAASARSTADLGVVIWEIGTDGSDTRIIGRDADSTRRVDMIIRRDAAAPDDRVSLDVTYPERAELQLTRDGLVDASPSAYLQQLGEDVHADLGQGKAHRISGGGLDATNSSLLIGDRVVSFDGTGADAIQVGWDLFGHGGSVLKGGACKFGTERDSVDCSAVNGVGSFCSWGSWETPAPAYTDCTIRFNVWVPGGHWDTFRWHIYSRPVNLAAGRAANQSSTLGAGTANRAVDGNPDGDWVHNSVTHTNFDFHAFWEVDLSATKNINSVVVFNRTDCCTERLSDFDLMISADHVNWQITPFFGQAPTRTDLTGLSAWGRWVRIQLRGTNFLSLAEVQVYAQ